MIAKCKRLERRLLRYTDQFDRARLPLVLKRPLGLLSFLDGARVDNDVEAL